MKSVLKKVQSVIFESTSNADLAAVRILFYLYILYCLIFQMAKWPLFAGHSPLFYEANGIFQFFKISLDGYLFLYYGAIISCLLAVLGLLGRWPMIAAFICFSFINSLPQFYSTLVALNSANTFILFVFCFTDAHKYYSVFSILKRKIDPLLFKPEFEWPIFYFRLIHVNFIFMSGFTKIWETGPDWIFTDNLKNHVLCSPLIRGEHASQDLISLNLGYKLSQFDHFYNLSAFFVVALELLFPLALFSKKIRKYLLVALFVFQISTIFILFINPVLTIGLYIFWIDWSLVVKKLRQFFRKMKPLSPNTN